MVFPLNTGLIRKVPSSSKLYRKRRECNKQVKRERNKLFNLTNYYLEGEYLFYPLNNNVKKKRGGTFLILNITTWGEYLLTLYIYSNVKIEG